MVQAAKRKSMSRMSDAVVLFSVYVGTFVMLVAFARVA